MGYSHLSGGAWTLPGVRVMLSGSFHVIVFDFQFPGRDQSFPRMIVHVAAELDQSATLKHFVALGVQKA